MFIYSIINPVIRTLRTGTKKGNIQDIKVGSK